MGRINIAFVIGTRPEAIKLAPVILEARMHNIINPILCCTGQHKEMLGQALEVFGLTPDHNLNLMTANQDLSRLTANAITGISELLTEVNANHVVVQGDTTTAFAGALASFYKSIPVWHVEAGLRTNNIHSPWPEEMNRILISRLSAHHFAPTEWARDNLIKEGLRQNDITVTGNTVIDSLLWITRNNIVKPVFWNNEFQDNIRNKKLIIVTTHRRENQDGTIQNICKAINKVAEREDVIVVLPMHLNPSVRNVITKHLGPKNNVYLTEPLEYREFIYSLQHCFMIVTDSGGIQEEAPVLGKPVLVVRDTTERPEAVQAGTARLIGKNEDEICKAINDLLDDQVLYRKMSSAKNPYGDGTASKKIVEIIIRKEANKYA